MANLSLINYTNVIESIEMASNSKHRTNEIYSENEKNKKQVFQNNT